MSISILGYHCLSSAGHSPEDLWNDLLSGKIHRDENGIARIQDGQENLTSRDRLVNRLLRCWEKVKGPFPPSHLGVILASTKGMLEDFIWSAREEDLHRDPLTPLLEDFLRRAELAPAHSLCVSNACASSHVAFYLAKKWIETSLVEKVLVLAVDEVGPFILKGFSALGALSPTHPKPFSKERDGLQLGEGAAAILFSQKENHSLTLEEVAIDTEGYSVTRPSPSGKSLALTCRQVLEKCHTLAGAVAHGTATKANDLAEEQCFASVLKTPVPITATKWCIGHTLGASGAMDLIAACEALKRETLFPMATTENIDPSFSNHYLTQGLADLPASAALLVTSLGFGGTHAALTVSR